MTHFWPGTSIRRSTWNAFTAHLDGTPSIFASDLAFTPRTAGKTTSQIASAAVDRQIAATGRSPGSIAGLSAKGNDLIEQGLSIRIRRGRG